MFDVSAAFGGAIAGAGEGDKFSAILDPLVSSVAFFNSVNPFSAVGAGAGADAAPIEKPLSAVPPVEGAAGAVALGFAVPPIVNPSSAIGYQGGGCCVVDAVFVLGCSSDGSFETLAGFTSDIGNFLRKPAGVPP